MLSFNREGLCEDEELLTVHQMRDCGIGLLYIPRISHCVPHSFSVFPKPMQVDDQFGQQQPEDESRGETRARAPQRREAGEQHH